MQYKINGFLLSLDLTFIEKDKSKLALSQQETDLLKLFLSSQDGFISTETIEATIWENKVVTNNSVRKLISGLRLKLDDKEAIKNIRGKGYQLTFDRVNPTHFKKSREKPLIVLTTLILLSLLVLMGLLAKSDNKDQSSLLKKVSTQTVFESNKQILDYAIHAGTLFVSTRDKTGSTLFKVINRQKIPIMTDDYSGAFRGIEIHESGRTAMHVVENAKCKIKIYNSPFKEQIDEIPCSRQNAFISFDWLDSSQLYLTFHVQESQSIKPYLYNLETKLLEPVNSSNFESGNTKRFIDAFIKSHGEGMFTLRENHLNQMSLMYFEGKNRREIFKYRTKPYSLAVTQNNLYFMGNNNEVLSLPLEENILQQRVEPNLLLAPQTTKVDDLLYLENNLYFSVGNIEKYIIKSTSGNFEYQLEGGLSDFNYTDGVLTMLAHTNTGYVVEQLRDNKIINSIYFDTELSLRHIAYFQNKVYLAGSSGIYRLEEGIPKLVSPLKTRALISNDQCMLAQSDGIHTFEHDTQLFKKISAQGERPFPSTQGCLFVDNLTGNIFNQNREKVAEQKMRKLLIEHKGRLAHRYHVGDETHIVDLETDELITKTKTRAMHHRMASIENDILYLALDDIETSIVKVKLY